MDQSEKIRANAEMVIQQLRPLSGMDFGYNAESVHWLQGYLERLRPEENFEARKEKFSSVFGSFLGECIIRCHGGHWDTRDGMTCIVFDDQNAAYPFNKIKKQLDNGLEDGIASFFDTIPILFEAQPPLRPRKPWWKIW